jgi:phosphopantetheinyl transferase
MSQISWSVTAIPALLHGDEVTAVHEFLNESEREIYWGFKTRKRQLEWLAGRVAIKRLFCLINTPGITPANLMVERETSGLPYLVAKGERANGRISISHNAGWVAVCQTDSDLRIGIDLEEIKSRDPAFLLDYFSRSEREQIMNGGLHTLDFRTNLIWSAKESVLKAISTGLGTDPLKVEIDGLNSIEQKGGWGVLSAGYQEDNIKTNWNIYYRNRIDTVLTLCVPDSGESIELSEIIFSQEDQLG